MHTIKLNIKEKEKRCAPSKKYSEGSCFTFDNLKDIAKQINNKFTSVNINLNQTKKELLKDLTKNLKNKYDCDDQLCWLNLDIVQDTNDSDIIENTFRPEGPDRGNEWLDSNNINNVLKQHEKIYSNFKSFGSVPIDFKTCEYYIDHDINRFSFNDLLNENKTKFGVIINLDYCKGKGTHWVALYSDLIEGFIYYFDSYGTKPDNLIQEYINKIQSFNKINGI